MSQVVALPAETVLPVVRNRGRRQGSLASRVLMYTYLSVVAVFAIAPLVLAWTTAFKSPAQVVTNPYGPPLPATLDNLTRAWTRGLFGEYFGNSVLISLISVAIMVVLSSMVGYALARIKFFGKGVISTVLILGLTIPVTAIILPLYSIMRNLGLLDTYAAVIIAHVATGLPFFAFLMRAFFVSLPGALEDAGRIDGCSDFRIYWSVMLPLVRPGLMTVALLEFMWTWNNLLLPLVFLTSDSVRPLPIGMLMLSGRFTNDYGLLSAGVLIVTMPIIVLFLLFQRKFVEGLASGAVKG